MDSNYEIPPPQYSEQDPGEYSYPGDKNQLVPNERRGQHVAVDMMSTHNWPAEGGYVPNAAIQSNSGRNVQMVPATNWPSDGGYDRNLAMQANEHPQQPIVVVQQQSSSDKLFKSYVQWRLAICCVVIVIKVIIIAIVFGVISSSN